MRVTGIDHIVLRTPDVEALVAWYVGELGLVAERLDQWRAGEVPFVSLRVDDATLVDVAEGEPAGEYHNMDHVALVVDGVDLDELAASGRFAIEMGPADLFGARGVGRGVYLRDPAGNRVELRTYA